jgi:glycosyltransferase involved in cell wall biosynthesis
VLSAARAAPELRFRLVGSGQLEELVRERPANVEWVPWVEYERLPDELRRAGCALGIFGTSEKANRVIPNKAFQALACATPLVTADTPGARELLVDGESALLVPPGDAHALAVALQRIAGDRELAQRLSAGGRAAYEARASEAVLGRRWRELVEQAVARA